MTVAPEDSARFELPGRTVGRAELAAVLALNGAGAARLRRASTLAASLARRSMLVAVDGGLASCRAARFAPDLLVGDGDSATRVPAGLERVSFPADKDFSDLAGALREARRRGAALVVVAGLLGGRLDHEWANPARAGPACEGFHRDPLARHARDGRRHRTRHPGQAGPGPRVFPVLTQRHINRHPQRSALESRTGSPATRVARPEQRRFVCGPVEGAFRHGRDRASTPDPLRSLTLVLLLLMPLATAGGLLAWLAAEDPRPSVLLITVDTLRADHLGIYGYERATSPNVDRLAEGCAVFDNAYTHSTASGPSHATMLTGLYPPSHGAVGNGIELPQGQITLAETLQAAGYETAAFVSHKFTSGEFGLDQGFDHSRLHVVPSRPRTPEDPPSDPPHRVFDAAVEWLDDRGDKPFFAWLHLQHPHLIYNPPPPWNTRFGEPLPDERRLYDFDALDEFMYYETDFAQAELDRLVQLYDGEIAYVDDQLERVFRTLRERGLSEETIVVFTADHGEMLFEESRPRMVGHGPLPFEPVMRVPLLLCAPDAPWKGRRVPQRVGLVDLAPTLHDLVGLDPSPRHQGRTLMPIVRGEEGDAREVEHSWSVDAHGAVRATTQSSRMKLICFERGPKWSCELYDLERDPGESTDVKDDPDYRSGGGRYAGEVIALYRASRRFRAESHIQMAGPVSRRSAEVRAMLREAGYLDPDR